ncbi:MAG: ATP-grasp domain-containing protein [Bdellovibrionales bacterium]|nr:ATP-grasp domain-containing protein [Bdellovibrionales bacterium]
MLTIEGFKMGHEMHVLSSSAEDPAAQVTRFWHEGDIKNPTAIKAFLKQVDVTTIESEFLAESILKDREIISNRSLCPSAQAISIFADRFDQKNWLEKHRIPTSSFSGLLTKIEAYAFLNSKKNRDSVVFKKRHFGYDGFGTFIVHGRKKIEAWLNKHSQNLSQYIIEDFIKFKRELAIQIAINEKKEVCFFPLVEWKAENSKCLWVKGPAKAKNLNPIVKKITHGLQEMNYVGLIAFEFFDTPSGLIVNEVAPRVHNSGHYSLEALAFNQFRAHLCAITNQPLPKKPIPFSKAFAMYNLIGETNKTPILSNSENVSLHWYGKSENRTGRKMGHLTALGTTPDLALKKLLTAKKGFKL